MDNLPKNETKKQKKQALTSLDSFQHEAMKVMDWIQKNFALILKSIAPLALIGLLTFGWKMFSDYQEQKKLDSLALIELQFNKEESEVQKARYEVYQKIMGDLNKEGDKDNESSAEDSEKKMKDLQAKMQSIKPDHTKTLAEYKKFFEENEKNILGWRAGLGAVRILVDLKNYAEAIVILNKILPQSSSLPFYDQHVRSQYISLLEEVGDYENALKEIDLILPKVSEKEKPGFLYQKASVLISKGEKSKAIEVFDKLIQEHNSSEEASKASAIKLVL